MGVDQQSPCLLSVSTEIPFLRILNTLTHITQVSAGNSKEKKVVAKKRVEN